MSNYPIPDGELRLIIKPVLKPIPDGVDVVVAEKVVACLRIEDLLACAEHIRALNEARKPVAPPKTYECPACKSNDPNRYVRCNHAGCPDGRYPR